MKLSFKNVMGIAVIALAISSCAKSGGGGGNASAPDASATCAATGACTLGGSGYVGEGNWKGSMIVSNLTAYQQFLYENGLNGGYSYFKLTVILMSGDLPGAGKISLRPVRSGRSYRGISGTGDALMISGGNGFQVTYDPRQGFGDDFNGGFGFGGGFRRQPYFGPGYNNNYNSGFQQPDQQFLTVTATFADQTHSRIQATVRYKQQILGTGVLYDANSGYRSGIYNQNRDLNSRDQDFKSRDFEDPDRDRDDLKSRNHD